MEGNKIREAVKFLAAGDKATEKNWFRKPEWDVAGQNYEKAASCFKAARSYEQAIQAYQKASDALFRSDSIYMSAKTMESAANLAAQQLNQPERAAEMYRKASDLYLTHMTPDRAAEMLEKGARALEVVNVDGAIDLYVTACTLFESEDRDRFAVDTFKRTIAVMIRHKRYEAAVDILHRLYIIYQNIQNQPGLNKTCLSIIIVLLAADDEVEAKKQFQLFCLHAFVQSEESAVASSLLDAFEQGDQELLEATVRRQVVTFLDNAIVRLARELQVPGGITQRFTPEAFGLNNNVNHNYDQQQQSTSSYDQKRNDLVDNYANFPDQAQPEFNQNHHEVHNDEQQKFAEGDHDIYDSYLAPHINENVDELPPPQHVDELPPPQHVDELPPPQHVDELPPPQHVDELPPPQHVDELPPPQHPESSVSASLTPSNVKQAEEEDEGLC